MSMITPAFVGAVLLAHARKPEIRGDRRRRRAHHSTHIDDIETEMTFSYIYAGMIRGDITTQGRASFHVSVCPA